MVGSGFWVPHRSGKYKERVASEVFRLLVVTVFSCFKTTMSTRLRACLQRPACVGCLINMIKTTKWDLGLLSVLFHDSAIRCNQAGVLLKSWSFVVPYQVYTRDLSLPKHGPFAPKGKASTWNKKRSGNEYLPTMTDDKHFPSNPPIGFICSRSWIISAKHQLVATLDFVLHP